MSDEQVDKKADIFLHLVELRRRVLICFAAFILCSCVAYGFADEIYGFLVAPLAEIFAGEDRRLIYTGLGEAFITVEVASGVQLHVQKGAIASVLPKGTLKSA